MHASNLSHLKAPCLLEYANQFQDFHQGLIYLHQLRGGRTHHTYTGKQQSRSELRSHGQSLLEQRTEMVILGQLYCYMLTVGGRSFANINGVHA